MIRVEKILVPTDFSESSREALCYAGALAERYKSKVLLLHVMESDMMEPLRAVEGGQDLTTKLKTDREEYLENLMKLDEVAGIEVESRIVEGPPAYEIIEAAEDYGADLITIGTQGLTGPQRVFFGSVAERVVRTAPIPVLTVRCPEHGFVDCTIGRRHVTGLKNILMPTDFSEASAYAARYATALAGEYGARLHLLHVVSISATGRDKESLESEAILEAQKAIEKFMEDRLAGLEVVRDVKTGTPFQEIVGEARKREADLIVTGTHGRTFLKYALLGSVASKVVRKAPCPVLSVKHPKHKFEKP
jgi:nucleotide-binding universal stress UspA family protein